VNKYTHLRASERRRIHIFLERGLSASEVGKRLNRDRSTIYRELKRNKDQEGYWPSSAEHKAKARRKRERSCRLQENAALYDYVVRRLKDGWSPEQIAGRMKLDGKPYYVCHETIYRYIYKQRNKKLYQYLRYRRSNRRYKLGRKEQRSRFSEARLITMRPEEINSRSTFGHWEGDSIAFSNTRKKAVTTLVERKSRVVILIKNDCRTSQAVMGQINGSLRLLPRKARQSTTFDQGAEFAHYRQLETQSNCNVFYCEAHSPWQKGSNENMNGRLRQYLPRSTDIDLIEQDQLNELAKKMNNSPRKCLGFMTPKELFLQYCSTNCRTWF